MNLSHFNIFSEFANSIIQEREDVFNQRAMNDRLAKINSKAACVSFLAGQDTYKVVWIFYYFYYSYSTCSCFLQQLLLLSVLLQQLCLPWTWPSVVLHGIWCLPPPGSEYMWLININLVSPVSVSVFSHLQHPRLGLSLTNGRAGKQDTMYSTQPPLAACSSCCLFVSVSISLTSCPRKHHQILQISHLLQPTNLPYSLPTVTIIPLSH